MKKLLIYTFILIGIITACNSRTNKTSENSKPVEAVDKFELEAINDYLSNIDKWLYEGATESLFKIVMDVNGDSNKDILLSGFYKGGWGNSGGDWTIYLRTESTFTKCDEKFSMYPSTARFNPTNQTILTYGRIGCCDGSLNSIGLKNCKIENALIEKFENDSDIDMKINQKFKDLSEFITYKAKVETNEPLNEMNWMEWK